MNAKMNDYPQQQLTAVSNIDFTEFYTNIKFDLITFDDLLLQALLLDITAKGETIIAIALSREIVARQYIAANQVVPETVFKLSSQMN